MRAAGALPWLLVGSGASALTYEVIWMRRLALATGSGALSVTLTVSALFGFMGLGGWLAGAWRGRRPARAYAALEAGAASWALGFPYGLAALTPWIQSGGLPAQALAVTALIGPPAIAMGATFPIVVRAAPGLDGGRAAASLYAANTAGGVAGVLLTPLAALPLLGVRGAELAAACAGLAVAGIAWRLPIEAGSPEAPGPAWRAAGGPGARAALIAAGIAGAAAMSLEVAWTRLGAVLLGPSIYAFAWVLATFLAGVALGAALGRRWERPQALGWSLGALGALALAGTWVYAQAPLILATLYDQLGPSGAGFAGVSLSLLVMAGAPVASGAVFARALASGASPSRVYGANTIAGVVGSAATGLWLLPLAGVQGVVTGAALLAAGAGAVILRRPWPLLVAGGLAALQPGWDGKLYAVGLYNRLSEFADLSPGAIRRFADEGWALVSYEDGRSAAVAVGRSTRTGNVWLSINGKVDASSGDDMPTQLLSGELPVELAALSGLDARRVMVVGLASGVTAGAVLETADGLGVGLEQMTVVELEPAVVRASHAFDHVNGRPLEDPRTSLVEDDARGVLARSPPGAYDVIISEPSNPWITGVSNLFTLEYWQLGRGRLAPGGVFCQWVQLYGVAPEDLRTILRTYLEVFPEAILLETVSGADALLFGINGPLPAAWGALVEQSQGLALGPASLRALAGEAPLNTDDRPRVELNAPRSLHARSGGDNAALLRSYAGRQGEEGSGAQ